MIFNFLFSFILPFALEYFGLETHAVRPSPEVTFQGDFLLYKGSRFTGILEEHFSQVGTVRMSHYRNGLHNGLEEEFFDNGKLASRRHYSYGKKEGLHEGWFVNGNRRFSHFFKDNQHEGEVWEWYSSGNLAMFARFDHGRLLGKKMWRETGQIYMNYVFVDDRAIGVPGTKLCYQVRGKQFSRLKRSIDSQTVR